MDDSLEPGRGSLDDEAQGFPEAPRKRTGPSRTAKGRQDVAESVDGRRFSDYVRALYKRRWLAIAIFATIIVGTLIYSFTVTPSYEARTRLLIEAEEPNVVAFKSVIDEQLARADYYTTQYNVLQSRSLARLTLESLHLWDTAPFRV